MSPAESWRSVDVRAAIEVARNAAGRGIIAVPALGLPMQWRRAGPECAPSSLPLHSRVWLRPSPRPWPSPLRAASHASLRRTDRRRSQTKRSCKATPAPAWPSPYACAGKHSWAHMCGHTMYTDMHMTHNWSWEVRRGGRPCMQMHTVHNNFHTPAAGKCPLDTSEQARALRSKQDLL